MTKEASQSDKTERLNRYLARCGIGSRRKADEIISAGRVTLNGVRVDQLATQVNPQRDKVAVDGRSVTPQLSGAIWILLNKPAGTLTTRRDTRGRATVFDLLPKEFQNLIPVGRLDLDTEGVILLTSDGEGANRLMHPRYQISRVYEATVVGVPAPSALARLKYGIDLGDVTPARAEVSIVKMHPRGVVLRLTLREGRKREVKRMMTAIGHPVLALKRVTFAGLSARGLREGQWRKLTRLEISRIVATS